MNDLSMYATMNDLSLPFNLQNIVEEESKKVPRWRSNNWDPLPQYGDETSGLSQWVRVAFFHLFRYETSRYKEKAKYTIILVSCAVWISIFLSINSKSCFTRCKFEMEVLETLGTDGDIPKGRTDFQAITYHVMERAWIWRDVRWRKFGYVCNAMWRK